MYWQFDEDKTLYGLITDELDFNGSLAFYGINEKYNNCGVKIKGK